jgi:hypothetical protein
MKSLFMFLMLAYSVLAFSECATDSLGTVRCTGGCVQGNSYACEMAR